jgi:hypothetical protein
MDPKANFDLVVTCCNDQGGLYSIRCMDGNYHIRKILDDNCRGISRYGSSFVLATATTVQLLDMSWNVIRTVQMKGADFHGVCITKHYVYVVDTNRNAVLIFQLPDLELKGQIKLHIAEHDKIHINDLYISGNRLFVSMFSHRRQWRARRKFGAIVEYSLPEGKEVKTHLSRLSQPHSVMYVDGNLYFCNSLLCEVRRGEKVIWKAPLYTRGLAIKAKYLCVGLCLSRHREAARHTNSQCGIMLLNRENGPNLWIPLPSREIYAILPL